MKDKYTWAGTAKLTWELVQQLRRRKHFTRADAAKVAASLGMGPESVWRAQRGMSWVTVRGRTKPDDWKRCVRCRKPFGRRFENGRYRSQWMWEQKKTCSHSCLAHLNWLRGCYADR